MNNKYLDSLKLYHMSQFSLYISNSNITNSGYGVFTKSFIPKDSVIDEYSGTYTESLYGGEYFFRIDKDGGINAIDSPRCYMAMLNDAIYIPSSKRALRKFVKHNYTNNCYFKSDIVNRKVYVYSLIDINPYSELFISYGEDYWK